MAKMNKIIFDKEGFSKRLVTARKEVFSSQARFAEEYNKRFLPESNISGRSGILGTLKKYENGNNSTIPSIDILYNMCSLLKCDVGYLLGLYDSRTREIDCVHSYTGLSEGAILLLGNKRDNSDVVKLLNDLIKYKSLHYLGKLYSDYQEKKADYINRNKVLQEKKGDCDVIEMGRDEFYEMLESMMKESEFRVLMEMSKFLNKTK